MPRTVDENLRHLGALFGEVSKVFEELADQLAAPPTRDETATIADELAAGPLSPAQAVQAQVPSPSAESPAATVEPAMGATRDVDRPSVPEPEVSTFIDTAQPLPTQPVPTVDEGPRWGDILPVAIDLLKRRAPGSYRQRELALAARERGAPIDDPDSLYAGLVARLIALAAVEMGDDGALTLSSRLTPLGPSPSNDEPRPPPDDIDELAEEVDACELFLEQMSETQRNAQLCVWAGRARARQQADQDSSSARRLRQVFGRLTRITREHRCGWCDALTPAWSVDWDVYVAWNTARLAGETLELAAAQERALCGARVRGLSLPTRTQVMSKDAADVLEHASAVLDAEDPLLVAALERFPAFRAVPRGVPPQLDERQPTPPPRGSSPAPRAKSRPSAVVSVPVVDVAPPRLVAASRGLRFLLVGGQGAREEHRARLHAALELAALDWVFSEKGAASHYGRLEERVKHASYDVVLFLAGYTSHKAVPFLKTCRASGTPLVYLAHGYSLTQIFKALDEQWLTARPRAGETVVGRAAPGAA